MKADSENQDCRSRTTLLCDGSDHLAPHRDCPRGRILISPKFEDSEDEAEGCQPQSRIADLFAQISSLGWHLKGNEGR